MKKPIKPRQPKAPIKPEEFYQQCVTIDYLSGDYNLQDLFDSVKEKYPDIELQDVILTEDGYFGEPSYSLCCYTMVKNKYYKTQMTSYNKKLKNYKKKSLEYEEKLKQYKKDLKIWEDWFKKQELKNKEKMFEQLKKELGK